MKKPIAPKLPYKPIKCNCKEKYVGSFRTDVSIEEILEHLNKRKISTKNVTIRCSIYREIQLIYKYPNQEKVYQRKLEIYNRNYIKYKEKLEIYKKKMEEYKKHLIIQKSKEKEIIALLEKQAKTMNKKVKIKILN